jgi:glycosyltransferase involved in cell wall biosynthesis
LEPSESKIRLLQIVTGPKPLLFVEGQLRLMLARGFEVHVACTAADAKLRTFCAEQGCHWYEVPISRAIAPGSDLRSILRLLRLIRQIRPTVVEAHQSKAGLVGMLAAKLAGVPVRIYINHGTAFASAHGLGRALIKQGERLTCAAATAVRFVSPSLRSLFVAEGCCAETKIRPVVLSICGVDAERRFNPERVAACQGPTVRERYGIPPDAPVLGFVGRLIRIKGIETLNAAWRILRDRFPMSHMIMVGDYDDRAPVPPAIRQSLSDDPRVHRETFTNAVASYYAAMDVLVLPSHHEGLGMVLLEANAMNVPTVGSRIPGTVDAIQDGVTGTLVEPRDTPGFVGAITAYFEDPELRRRHGQSGREWVLKEFRPEDVWEAIHQDYLDILRQTNESQSCAFAWQNSPTIGS